jgi:tetratricopeptide (TPR) repeat protein
VEKSFPFSSKGVSASALLLLLGSFALKWLDVPLGSPVKSYQLSLFSERLGLKPAPVLVSFGAAVLFIFLVGAVSIFIGKRWMKLLTGYLAVFFALLLFFKIAVYNTGFADDLYRQNVQAANMLAFDTQLPPNRGVDPTFNKGLSSYSVTYRLALAWHFTTFGWYLLMGAGVIFLILGLRERKGKELLMFSLIPSFFILLLLMGISVKPLSAEYHKSKGEAYLAAQEYRKSFDSFRAALSANSHLAANEDFALKYGEAAYNLGLTDSPYYYLYWGNKLFTLKRRGEAEHMLSRGAEISGGDPDLKWAMGRMLSSCGIEFYAHGVTGAAVSEWNKSIALVPELIQNWYYLSFVYTKLGRYGEAISAGKNFTGMSTNDTLSANAYANMGDACYWQKDYLMARQFYQKSRGTDVFTNYRAGRSLGGV